LGCTDAELSVLIVDDGEMTRLNREFRGVDETTDVLAFPMREGEYSDVEPDLLGDVVISAPTARILAETHGAPLEAVLDLLLVHGTLHLLGFDHDEPEEARLMDAKTLELLRTLGHGDQAIGWYTTSSSRP